LGLDAGSRFLRGGIVDVTGRLRARSVLKARAANAQGRIAELVELAGNLFAEAGIGAAHITQTVLGCPGVYDRRRDALILAGALPRPRRRGSCGPRGARECAARSPRGTSSPRPPRATNGPVRSSRTRRC